MINISEAVNHIRDMKIGIEDKISVLLTILDRKPTSTIILDISIFEKKYINIEKDTLIDKEDLLEIEKKLKKLELSFKITGYSKFAINSYFNLKVPEYVIAKNDKFIKYILKTYKKNDSIKFGKYLGYPKSSLVQEPNFVNYVQMVQNFYSKENVPEEILYISFVPKFVNNKIDEEHLEWGRTNMELVKRFAFDLHREYVSSRKKIMFDIRYR